MSYDLEHHSRGILTKMEARSSLRRFKKTDGYRSLLRVTIRDAAQLEKRAKTETQKRRARLDRVTAALELEQLQLGTPPSEFAGLLSLPDPLKGMD